MDNLKDDTEAIITIEGKKPLKTTVGAIRRLARGFKKSMTGPEAEKIETYQDLGWMNAWGEFPDLYVLCKGSGHKRRDISHCDDGSHHEVICDTCHIVWHYDSSG